MSEDFTVSREMTRVICAVPGVVDVFPSRSLVQSIADSLVESATGTAAGDAKVVVSRDDAGVLTATATIGVDAGFPTPDTLRAVGDEVRRHLVAAFPREADPIVNVCVSHIATAAVP